MANHVDLISITVTGFATELYVQSFELIAAVNTIPQISLNVLPIKSPAKGNSKYITASAPSIKDITALQKELLPYTLKLDKTATIEIKMTSKNEDENEKDQTIKLEDWVFTDVGLSSIHGAGPAPVLSLTFCHPAVFLVYTGTIYEEVKNGEELTDVYQNASGDVISFMSDIYNEYSGGAVEFYDIAPLSFGGPTDTYKKKVESFRDNLSKHPPKKYIEGNTNGMLFMEHVNQDLSGNIRIATGRMLSPVPFGGSTWNRLISTVCADHLVTIAPTYDKEKLKLEPFSPWQASIYDIKLPIVESVEAQVKDPLPILGTAVRKIDFEPLARIDANVLEFPSSEEDVEVCMNAFYFPQKALEDDTIGTVLSLQEANVINAIISADQAANATKDGNATVGEDLESAGNGVEDMDREELDEAYAKAMFLARYRAECKGVITTIPIFKDSKGQTIYPGRVLCLNSKEGELFYGYLTRLTVSGTTEGGAYSRFELSHIRPCNASDGLYVEEGTENPCYPPVNRR